MRFVGRSPFSFAALDIKTMAMIMLGKDYRYCSKKTMPKRWFGEFAHTHVALDDAIEQGVLFCNMLAESRGGTRTVQDHEGDQKQSLPQAERTRS
jgi:hypothetical protein